MADYYQMVLDSRAKKIINAAEEKGLGYSDVMREAAKAGVADNASVINYAKTLRNIQDIKNQEQITGTVGRAMTMPGLEEAVSLPPREFAAKMQEQPSAYQPPTTEEQFYGAMGRQQIPSDATMQDVIANPAYQFALGQLPGGSEEMGWARLKMQQEDLARKKAQGDEQNRLRAIGSKQKSYDNALQYYKLGLKYQEGDIGASEKLNTLAEDAEKDRGFVEANLDKWKKIKKGSDEFGTYTPEEADAQIAMLETQWNTLDTQAKALRDRAKNLRSGAYGKGRGISKGSKTVFEGPATEVAPPVQQPPSSAKTNVAEALKDLGL